jgi:glycosyltransferase involved in cell wall biosynthesis
MRILYVNHTSRVSGAERSLLDVLSALPPSASAWVASPDGDLADRVRGLGCAHASITGTAGSLRLHGLHTPRAVVEILGSAWGVRRLAREVRPHVIAANSIRAGLIAGLSTIGGGPPVVVHVRDVLPPSAATRAVVRFISGRSAALVANSSYARSKLRTPAGTRVELAHSPVDVARFDPSRVDRVASRRRLGLDGGVLALGVVAQITPWKGQRDAVEALAILRRRGTRARLLLAGSTAFVDEATRYDNRAYLADLRRRVELLQLQEEVLMLGHREDIPEVMAALDLLLVPSWEEPMGRTVLEGMAMERPVIATSVGGPSELLVDGTHGRLVPPRRAELLAATVIELASNPGLRARMGRRARQRAMESFALERHVPRLLEIYSAVLDRRAVDSARAALSPEEASPPVPAHRRSR